MSSPIGVSLSGLRRLALGLFVVVCVVHGTTGGTVYHYDDIHAIVDNPNLRDVANIPAFFLDPSLFSVDADRGMYRPVLLITYALEHALFGDDASTRLRLNLILHGLNAVLVLCLAWQFTGRTELALLAGALFGLQPLVTEPIHYVSARSDSLSTLFFLAAVAAWMWADKGGGRHKRVLAVVSVTAAMFTKATAIVLPAALLGLDLVRGRRRPADLCRRHGPLWLVTALYLACSWSTGFLPRSLAAPQPQYVQHALTQLKAMVWYLWRLSWPVGGSVEPAFDTSTGSVVIVASLLLLGLCVAGIASWRSDLRTCASLAAAGALTLLPTALMPLNVLVNERRLYLPLALMAVALALLLRRARSFRSRRGYWRGLALTLTLVLALLAHQRGAAWAAELSLWQDAVRRGPHMPRAQLYLGDAHLRTSRSLGDAAASRQHRREARTAYDAVLSLAPEQRMLSLQAANGLALLALEEGDLNEAERQLQSVLEQEPKYVDALVNLGNVFYSRARNEIERTRAGIGTSDFEIFQDLDRAAARYRQALGLAPLRHAAHVNLGACLHLRGDLPGARRAYETAVSLAPLDVVTRQNLSKLYLEMSRQSRRSERRQWLLLAREQLSAVIALQPDDTHAQQAFSEVRLLLEEREDR